MTRPGRTLLLVLTLALGLSGQALAQSDPGRTARLAAAQLQAAARAMSEAKGARNRVAALTDTILAYEQGLAALREGLRQASVRERDIRRGFDAESERLGQIVGALLTMGRSPETLLLLHPSGPVGTARSGMILTEVTPAILAEVSDLRARLDELTMLRVLQESASETLLEGLRGVQSARTALSKAVSDRTDLPVRVTEDTAQMQRLLDSADTLDGFASGLTVMPLDPLAPVLPDFSAGKGALRPPVEGRLLHGFREADAAGIRRPGLVIATAPGALVTAPWPATIRYVGPLLDYGNVMILEPGEGYLLVLAGLDTVYGEAGQVLPEGAPLGLMPGSDDFGPAAAAANSDSAEGGGASGAESLYMELREGQRPVDPANWFTLDEE